MVCLLYLKKANIAKSNIEKRTFKVKNIEMLLCLVLITPSHLNTSNDMLYSIYVFLLESYGLGAKFFYVLKQTRVYRFKFRIDKTTK